MTNFSGKVVWVVGASSGIGEALALNWAEHGSKLILSGRREKELKEVAEKCGQKAASVDTLVLDVTREDQVVKVSKNALSLHQHIDYLVLCAGVSQRAYVQDSSLEVYKKLMDVNFFGAISVTKEILPSMIERKTGHIVVISSVIGKFGTPLRSGYAASKHALHGYYDSLRAEVHQFGLRVTLVCPGFIHTDISKKALKADGTAYGKMDESFTKGISAEECARRIVGAVNAGKEEIVIADLRERAAVIVKRLFPAILSKFVRKLNPL